MSPLQNINHNESYSKCRKAFQPGRRKSIEFAVCLLVTADITGTRLGEGEVKQIPATVVVSKMKHVIVCRYTDIQV